ncbi:hypothetical protein LZK98_00010 [Sphingomonas cannabina]|uniref:hypothetical protein n=1 Tax=Sphingomonas cannabina TaxID=2899123 RepID=UPI001F319BC2|nr:hypothetical protein [Sphingomonas cannabina]UIJ45390.1 hypothetical protein LZK98_00010 [Sphingomonas cannabina]
MLRPLLAVAVLLAQVIPASALAGLIPSSTAKPHPCLPPMLVGDGWQGPLPAA